MGDLLLSRTLDPSDYGVLQDELRLVSAYAPSGHGVHPQQQWEWVIALHAIDRWVAANQPRADLTVGPIYDVGGTGRPFAQMLRTRPGCQATLVVDPAGGGSLVRSGVPLADVITCFSGLAHAPDPEAFLYELHCLLAPGGLLVLTMPYWNKCGPDTATNHHLRQRIYCPKKYQVLRAQAQALQLSPFGGVDPTWHGAHLHEYSLASLVLEKRQGTRMG